MEAERTGEQERRGVAAEKAPEGAEVVQELEPVDVVGHDQLLVPRGAAQEDREHLPS